MTDQHLEHPLRPTDYEAQAYKLLSILLVHAPTSAEQMECTAWYSKIQKDGAHGGTLEMTVASALVDGLRYGNWPWTLPPKMELFSVAPNS